MLMEFKFTPLIEFEWWRQKTDDEGAVIEKNLIGQYLPGMSYNCTKDSRHDALREQCVKWEKEGKIKILALAPGQSFKTFKVGN